MASQPEILTVGHSNHDESEFIELLQGAGIQLIADVRRYPGSRRQPHFERSALAALLREAGIDYRWLGESLGGRRRPSPDSTNDGWESEQFRGYADHMQTDEFRRGLDRLETLASAGATAIMCAEAEPSRCHRGLLSDALLLRGWQVLHVLDSVATEHVPSPAMRTVDGRPVYP